MQGTRPAEVHPVLFDIFAMSQKVDGELRYTLLLSSKLPVSDGTVLKHRLIYD